MAVGFLADVGGLYFPSCAKLGIIRVYNIGIVSCIYRKRTLIRRLFFLKKIFLHIVLGRREMQQMILLIKVQISLPMKFYLSIYFCNHWLDKT